MTRWTRNNTIDISRFDLETLNICQDALESEFKATDPDTIANCLIGAFHPDANTLDLVTSAGNRIRRAQK